MTPGCIHCCDKCGLLFECAPHCSDSCFGKLCSSCVRKGFEMGECPACKDLVPLKAGERICANCATPRLVA